MLNTSKTLLVVFLLGVGIGIWGTWKLAPRGHSELQEATVRIEGSKAVQEVVVTRTVKEPGGRVETVIERKKTSQATAQEVRSSKTEVVKPVIVSKYRVEVGLDLRGSLQTVGVASRVLGPVWLGVQYTPYARQHSLAGPSLEAVLLTVGVEF